VAEWLGSALQKLLQRFESARRLKEPSSLLGGFFIVNFYEKLIKEAQKLLSWLQSAHPLK
jgi:hypothetical protein